MIDPAILDTIGGAGLGAAVGFGTFVGYVRSNMRTLKEMLQNVEAKIEKMDKKIDGHAVTIARIDARCQAIVNARGRCRLDPPDNPAQTA